MTPRLAPAPYYSFIRHGWVPCVVAWDPETGRFTRVEGPDAFTTWGEAEEASPFLLRARRVDIRFLARR
jgi:hypothetical protein